MSRSVFGPNVGALVIPGWPDWDQFSQVWPINSRPVWLQMFSLLIKGYQTFFGASWWVAISGQIKDKGRFLYIWQRSNSLHVWLFRRQYSRPPCSLSVTKEPTRILPLPVLEKVLEIAQRVFFIQLGFCAVEKSTLPWIPDSKKRTRLRSANSQMNISLMPCNDCEHKLPCSESVFSDPKTRSLGHKGAR